MAPRTFAERPKALLPEAANDNRPVLGIWQNGTFRFASPHAKERWARASYEQGVNQETWHFGKEVEAGDAALMKAGFGGAHSGLYQGPDGRYRLMNPKTIEPEEARSHRNQHLTGKTFDQLANATTMPGADEWVAKWKAREAANENARNPPPISVTPAQPALAQPALAQPTPVQSIVPSGARISAKPPVAVSNAQTVAAKPPTHNTSQATAQKEIQKTPEATTQAIMLAKERIASPKDAPSRPPANPPEASSLPQVKTQPPRGGRYGPLRNPQSIKDNEDVNDIVRIGTNAILGDYGDEVRAALEATGAWFDDRTFSETYDSHLEKEKAETAAAHERQGLGGLAAEIAPGFIPILGDVAGAIADVKDWHEHGDEWGWDDYGLVIGGAIPGFPSRRNIKKGKKAIDQIIETKKLDEAKRLKPSPTPANDLGQHLPNSNTKVMTEAEARKLTDRNRGVIYVTETFPGKEEAKLWNDGTTGAFSSIEHQRRAVPTLRFDNADGRNFIKFDGIEAGEDGYQILLLDAKRALPLWNKSAMEDLEKTIGRIKKAVEQNNLDAINGIIYKVIYEFPNQATANAAVKFIKSIGRTHIISVRVRKR